MPKALNSAEFSITDNYGLRGWHGFESSATISDHGYNLIRVHSCRFVVRLPSNARLPKNKGAQVMSLPLKLGLIYLISELLLAVTRRSRSSTGTKQDRSTLRVLWLTIMLSVAAGIYVAGLWPAAALPYGRTFVIAGVVLFVAGLLLRWWAIITLGRFFTVDVTIEKDHELVERGPFRVVRHPSYTGVLLAFVGFALSLRNWAALLVILLPIGAAFIHRMNVEEEALARALGRRYADYMKRTKRLVPLVY